MAQLNHLIFGRDEVESIFWRFKTEILLFSLVFLFLIIQKILKSGMRLSLAGKPPDLEVSTLKIPQPPGVPILGNLLAFINPWKDQFKLMTEWGMKYGEIFKIVLGREEFVILNNSQFAQKALSSSSPHHLNKHRFVYDTIFTGYINQGIAAAEYPIWSPHRKVLARSFTYKALQNQLRILNIHAKDLVAEFQDAINDSDMKGENLPFTRLIQSKFLKIIIHIAMNLEIISEEERHIIQDNFSIGLKLVTTRLLQPLFWINPIWKLHLQYNTLKKAETILEQMIKVVVERYRERRRLSPPSADETNDERENEDVGARNHKCMMEEMLDAGMNDKEIYNESLTMILAGYETTSWSLTFLLTRLALYKKHQELCRLEVDQLFEKKIKGNGGIMTDLTFDDLVELKHMERCIFENLRLTPIFPVFARRLDGPLKLDDDITLSAGTNIGISPWTLHRDPKAFPDPEVFDPERFTAENSSTRHAFQYIPFSGGARNCIGWKNALMSLKVMTCWILRNYEVDCLEKSWDEVKLNYSVSVTLKKDVNLIFRKRSDL